MSTARSSPTAASAAAGLLRFGGAPAGCMPLGGNRRVGAVATACGTAGPTCDSGVDGPPTGGWAPTIGVAIGRLSWIGSVFWSATYAAAGFGIDGAVGAKPMSCGSGGSVSATASCSCSVGRDGSSAGKSTWLTSAATTRNSRRRSSWPTGCRTSIRYFSRSSCRCFAVG